MKVHPSALKHGIGADDTIQAATWSLCTEDLNVGDPFRQLRIGFDTQNRLLEN